MIRLFSIAKRYAHNNIKHDIMIYSCKKKQKIPLKLRNPFYSTWYTCGPTVYDEAHIGHACTYVRLDIIQRILRDHFGINLITCMNITNIDDKIIKKGIETGRSWKVIADEFEAKFWEDLDCLKVVPPNLKLRVTDKIPEIISFIEKIESKGFTKCTEDGSVYFKTPQFENYGKLKKLVLDGYPSNAEFALWKGAKPNEPYWETKWGKGRPGWHIECSTLASIVFGSNLDFHAGGADLIFPHHENEEAQSCVYHSVQDWVTNWIHTGHLHLKGQEEKMSKSLKNTVSIQELLQNHSSNHFRMACLLTHYRSSIDFDSEVMTSAETVLKKVKSFREDCRAFIQGLKGPRFVDEEKLLGFLESCQREVDAALRDDFSTSQSISSIMKLMSNVSKIINNVPLEHASLDVATLDTAPRCLQAIVNYVDRTFETFGVSERETSSINIVGSEESLINSVVKLRNDFRLRAKKEKNKDLFEVCDSMRNMFKENNIEIKDHGENSSWNKI